MDTQDVNGNNFASEALVSCLWHIVRTLTLVRNLSRRGRVLEVLVLGIQLRIPDYWKPWSRIRCKQVDGTLWFSVQVGRR